MGRAIEERKRNGWTPKKNDFLFVPEASASKNDQMAGGRLWEVIKSCAEKADSILKQLGRTFSASHSAKRSTQHQAFPKI